MPEDAPNHLSPEELAWLADGSNSPSEAVQHIGSRAEAELHVAGCDECAARVRAGREVQAKLFNLRSRVVSQRSAECPSESRWAEVAVGRLFPADAAVLLEHAATCQYCGPLLREATEDLNSEVLPDEQEQVSQLPSARGDWQAKVARRMAARAEGEVEAEKGLAMKWSRSSAFTWNRLRWAVPVAAIFAIAMVGAKLWLERFPSLSSTNELIAQAYAEGRPFEMRFANAPYGPLRQRRGDKVERMDLPAVLLEADRRIDRALARNPDDIGWALAQGRAELLEGSYGSAVETLTRAAVRQTEDDSLRLDLAIAHNERAKTQKEDAERAADRGRALQLLNEILTKNPKNAVALFNRAVVYEQMNNRVDAARDWERYLQLDADGEWAQEARERMGSAH